MPNVLTIRVNIEDKEAAKVLWDSMGNNTPIFGCVVRAMGWGDVFAEKEAYYKRYEMVKEMLEREGCWDQLDKLDRLERLFPVSKIRGIND